MATWKSVIQKPMTSNSQYDQSVFGNFNLFHFSPYNNNFTDVYTTGVNQKPGYFGIKLAVSKKVNKLQLWSSGGAFPKKFTIQGSNDGSSWLDIYTDLNVPNRSAGTSCVLEFPNKNSYLYYRLYDSDPPVNNYGSNRWEIGELDLYELVYDYKTLVFSNGSIYYYKDGKWVGISSVLTEDLFLEHGMDDISIIPEIAWNEFDGDLELCHWTDNPDRSEVQFNIETEPFTLEDELAGQTIKLIEYTDNASQTESSITLETEPFTLYDEFGDSVDVLYYTDNPDKNSAQIELTHNYSPLDDLNGDFEIVTWVSDDELEDLSVEMNALPFEQIIISPEDFSVYGTLKNILINKIGSTGTLKLLMSFDGGDTWESCRYGKWTQINVKDINAVKENAMSIHDAQKITEKHLADKNKKFCVAYYLDESIHMNDPLKVDNIKIISNSPTDDVKFTDAAFYLLNTVATINIKVAGNKIIGKIDDEDKGKVQYRVFLNGTHYYPMGGGFTRLEQSPLDISINISERDLIFGAENTLKVEFQDAWGQLDSWETKFIGTYSGLMFMDENKQYFSDTFGGVLKYLDFDIIVAGQTTIDQKVIVKNQLGERVQNLLLEVQRDSLPDGVDIQMSYTSSPFIAEDFILFNKFIEPDEENEFYVRIATQIDAKPVPSGQFEIRAKVDPV